MLETTYGRTAAAYVEKLTALKPRNVDDTYGLKWIPSMQVFTIGNTPARIKNDTIQIGNKQYTGRPGLYELLVKKNPDKTLYTSYDLSVYKEILEKTSAHKVDYDENQNINATNSNKYKHIIKKLFLDDNQPSTSSDKPLLQKQVGRGMLKDFMPKNKIDYIYWDDPNELIDRLRLLLASTAAGNNSHNNEIQEIIAELKEKQYII